jgi:hypothetical protein
MLDVLVAEVSLQRSGVVTGVSQREAAGMSQHVWMSFDLKAACSTFDHSGKAGR